jgi:hypothetical protein
MKKLFLISACFVLAFSACKKDSAKSSSSISAGITATIGSSNFNFSTAATAQATTGSGIYTLQVLGETTTGSSAQGVSISIESDKPIAKGTYSISASDTSSFTQVTYVENASISNPVSFSSESGTVTITVISGTNVQGTFSGSLLSDQDGTTTEALTNGKFNVSLITTKQQ